jgi:hypothetical protein
MKRTSIGMTMCALVFAALASVGIGQAANCGDGGSPANSAGSCETADNHVVCGDGEVTPAGTVTVSDNGAELFNDGSSAVPVEGRVGAEGPDCDCIYADGTVNNEDPADGWARVDQNGVTCDADGEQSYNSGPGTDCM